MQINNETLIKELLLITETAQDAARSLKLLPLNQLNFKASATEWSALECIEHLNLYGDFYLPEIETKMLTQASPVTDAVFRSGYIGNYFANLMQVKDGKLKKMKSPKDKDPSNSILTLTTVDRFIKQLELLKTLLLKAKSVDLTHIKTSISLTRFIKTRLGDTFRFVIYHIERHVQQAERSVSAYDTVRVATEAPLAVPGSLRPTQTIHSTAI